MSWLPVLEIGRHWQEPSHEAFQVDLLGEEMLRQAKVSPGELSHLRLSPLSKETEYIEDPLVGQIPFRAREISPEYSFRWLDTGASGAMAWLQPELDEELAQRKTARDGLEATITKIVQKGDLTLEQVLDVSRANKSKTQDARIADWNTLFAALKQPDKDALLGQVLLWEELDPRGIGFLDNVPNLYGTGAQGVRWNFAVPNIEKVLLSSWNLQADQKQCFRIKRMQPLPAQGKRAEFRIVIGNGWTQYALVFSKEEAVMFLHYRNMKPRARAILEDELQTILEDGFLTAEDDVQIQEWQTEVALLKKSNSKSGSSTPDGATQSKIASLKKKIKDRRDAKNGLTDALERRRDALIKKLYYARVPVSLQEDTRSLFERDFAVTLGFHRRGFVSIRIGLGARPGAEAFYYEVEGITKTGQPGVILPANSKIMLRSSGGAFGIVYGVADHAPLARLVTQPIEIPFTFDPNEWTMALDAIGARTAIALASSDSVLSLLPRTSIEARIELFEEGFNYIDFKKNPKIRIVLEFKSAPHPDDGSPYTGNRDYGAELYRATAFCVAGELPFYEKVWNSSEAGFRIEDVQLQSDMERGATHEVFIRHTPFQPSGLPADLEGRYFNFGMVQTEGAERGTFVPLVTGGKITRPESPDARFFTRLKSIVTGQAARVGGNIKATLLGLEAILDAGIRVPLNGNGMLPNEYIRALCLMNGVPEELLEGVPQGQIPGLNRLPPGRVGAYPDIKPNVGDSLWQFVKDRVLKHCIGWRMRCDGVLGVTLEENLWRDRRDLNFRSNVPAHHPQAALRPLHPWQDTSEYTTRATFIGAYNAGTGKRFQSTHRIWEATHKPGSAYYIGREKPYIASPDDSLRSQTAVDLAARSYMMRQSLPPWMVGWTAWYDPDVREGDWTLHDGVEVILWRLTYPRFTRGVDQKVSVLARLFEDINVPGHADLE